MADKHTAFHPTTRICCGHAHLSHDGARKCGQRQGFDSKGPVRVHNYTALVRAFHLEVVDVEGKPRVRLLPLGETVPLRCEA